MRLGYVYLITNKINGKKYVGQTSRDIWTRFDEHCYNKKGNSGISAAIQKYGRTNFSIECLEKVSLDLLDEREKYWIAYYNSNNKEYGYNLTIGGKNIVYSTWNKVQIVENGLIADSIHELARIMSALTSWKKTFLVDKITEVVDTDKLFLNYHFITLPMETIPSDTDDLENWVKTLAIRFQGQHIYCIELDKEFETIGEAAQYMLTEGLYTNPSSKAPIQALVSKISQHINGKTQSICGDNNTIYHFEKRPGTTKQSGGDFVPTSIYCPQLDKTFKSQTEAANYFIDNKIWTGIKLKTAKLRISDIVRGAFTEYKGYTFTKV